MAQRKPTPIHSAIEVLPAETAIAPFDPIGHAIQRPAVPTRTQLLAERQAAEMLFRTERTKAAITKSVEVVDHATAEATASLLYSRHLERGFGDELSAEESAYFAAMRQLALDATGAISAEAAEALRAMARERGLPTTEVTTLDVVIRWLLTH